MGELRIITEHTVCVNTFTEVVREFVKVLDGVDGLDLHHIVFKVHEPGHSIVCVFFPWKYEFGIWCVIQVFVRLTFDAFTSVLKLGRHNECACHVDGSCAITKCEPHGGDCGVDGCDLAHECHIF